MEELINKGAIIEFRHDGRQTLDILFDRGIPTRMIVSARNLWLVTYKIGKLGIEISDNAMMDLGEITRAYYEGDN